MRKLSSKAKSDIIIAGMALVCIGAIVAVLNIGSNGNVAAAESVSSASNSPSTSMVVSVPPIERQIETESGTSSAFVPSSGASQAAELTEIQKPTSAPPAPSVASGTNLTDKNKKPSYSSKPTAAKHSTTKKANRAPKGKSYMPGFGYVDGNGGGQMTTVDGDWGGGSQVGTMD
jgi:hypothetical protein